MLSKHQSEKSFEKKAPPTYHDCDQTIWKLGSPFNSLSMYPKTWRGHATDKDIPVKNPTRYLIGGGIGHGHCQAEVGFLLSWCKGGWLKNDDYLDVPLEVRING